jgi:hypothetical protein
MVSCFLFIGLPIGVPVILLREMWLKWRGIKDVDTEKLIAMMRIVIYSSMATSLLILCFFIYLLTTHWIFGVV